MTISTRIKNEALLLNQTKKIIRKKQEQCLKEEKALYEEFLKEYNLDGVVHHRNIPTIKGYIFVKEKDGRVALRWKALTPDFDTSIPAKEDITATYDGTPAAAKEDIEEILEEILEFYLPYDVPFN